MATRVTLEMIEAVVLHFGKQTIAATRLGVTQSTVSRWLKGSKPDTEQAARILEIYEEIGFDGSEVRPAWVPLVGYVGAGAEITMFASGDGELDRVLAPDSAKKSTVAAQIRGTSLGELFDNWIVFYDDVRHPFTDDLLGRVCIVGLTDGRVLIKKVVKGQLAKHFNLISNSEPPIYDAQIEWAAKITDMRPHA